MNLKHMDAFLKTIRFPCLDIKQTFSVLTLLAAFPQIDENIYKSKNKTWFSNVKVGHERKMKQKNK